VAVLRIKGLNRVKKRRKDGTEVVHWYAWKGGPPLKGKPGSAEFIASYNEAVAQRKAGPQNDTLAGLVQRYRTSPEFQGLADSTRKEWARWLDRVAEDKTDKDIGGLPVKLLDDRRVRADLLEWRDQWANRPRSADYAIQVLSRVLGWAHGRGLLAINAAAGTEQLYSSNRADQIWTRAEVSAFIDKAPSPEVSYIIRLACLTGLRREDLVTVTWAQVGDLAILKPTGKSRGQKVARIPLLRETKDLLHEIRAQQAQRYAELIDIAARKKRPTPLPCATVLSNTRGKPWSVNGAEHQVIDTKTSAGIDKHLHDARGTFATRLRKAGLTAPEIADIMGWEEDRVQRLLSTYVDQDAVVQELAERIERNESGPR
jgi:integrase